MRRFGQIIQVLSIVPLLLGLAGTAESASPVTTDHVTAQMLPESRAARPGGTLWVMLHLKIKDGWHTYWRNPGDSGEPPHIVWTLPDGAKAGDIQWPYPDPLPYGPLLNYGYSKEAFHLVPIRIAEDWPADKPVRLQAKASWLACSDICVPEGGNFDLTLDTTATAQADPATADLFRKARERLPVKPDWSAGVSRSGDKVVLTVSGTGLAFDNIEKASFFPYKWGVVEPAAPQSLSAAPNGLSLTLTPGQKPDPERLEGVLVLTESGGGSAAVTRAYEIAAAADTQQGAVGGPAAGSPPAGASDRSGAGAAGGTMIQALLFAVLGGIILNLMPCVFPVLSMKAIALIRHAEKDARTVRRHGIAYALGVLSCFGVLAGLLIAFKAGGTAVGWGFQLQSPLFVAAMAYLFFLLGLNLSGAFEFGSSIMG
ncbi:MAG TPA: protein-disulfide reductase DsbD domain-containing protein, partial [Alphaproteobacteria bacterium]|nr:protein-disulfide reductase DsbD domain-containing protein [Alphaproteobacteria bacterium]